MGWYSSQGTIVFFLFSIIVGIWCEFCHKGTKFCCWINLKLWLNVRDIAWDTDLTELREIRVCELYWVVIILGFIGYYYGVYSGS